MPFQSEKQRRFLHANHPQIAKRWEKEYAGGGTAHLNFELNQLPEYYLQAKKGGIANHFRKKFEDGTEDPEYLGWLKTYEINPDAAAMHPNHEHFLQIYNESMMQQTSSNGILDTEESEMDVTTAEAPDEKTGGEMINLFAENVEDQSNAPTTLFMNSGGISQLVKSSGNGKRPGYRGSDWGDWAGGEFDTSAPKSSAPSTVNIGASLHGGPSVKETFKNLEDKQHREAVNTEFQGTVEMPYALDLHGITPSKNQRVTIHQKNVDKKKLNYEKTLATQKSKMMKTGLSKLVMPAIMIAFGVPPKTAVKSISLGKGDFYNIVKNSIPVMQAKKEYIRALENAKGVILSDVDLNNPKEMKSLEETTNLVKINEEIKNLTKKKDDDEETRDGQPELPPILEEPADEEDQYASFITDYLGKIREKQQLRASLKDKDIIQDNEIATDDITMTLNKGGLANLFRVKNQY